MHFMSSPRSKWLMLLVALAMTVTMFAGCAGEEEKPVLTFYDGSWGSLWLENAIAMIIIGEGYGYECEEITVSTDVMNATHPKVPIVLQKALPIGPLHGAVAGKQLHPLQHRGAGQCSGIPTRGKRRTQQAPGTEAIAQVTIRRTPWFLRGIDRAKPPLQPARQPPAHRRSSRPVKRSCSHQRQAARPRNRV